MNEDRYPFVKGLETFSYEFISEGPNGRIRKVARFLLLDDSPHIYNLGFGDWDAARNDIDDMAKTNNNDRQKILATVAYTVIDFTRNNPDAIIFAQGSTASRTRLYQIGISSFLNEITAEYLIFGYIEDEWRLFKKGVNYEAFSLKKK